jgi:hypothetical protein
MATQEMKHIETYVDMAGYRFDRYAKWLSRSKDCDDDLLKALGGGSGPRELLKKVLAKFREESCTSNGSLSLHDIVRDLDKPLRKKPIGNLDSLPLGYQEVGGYYLDKRLKLRHPRRHEDGLIISFQTMLYKEYGHVATGVCKLLIKTYKTETVLVVLGNYPEALCHRTIYIGPDVSLAFGRGYREARRPLRTRRFGDQTLRYRNARIGTQSEGKDFEANKREECRRVGRRTSRSAGGDV